MEVSVDIKNSLPVFNHKFMMINGKSYYVKECDDNFNLKEIIAKRLADILGIKCASYDIIKCNDTMYYISEDLKNLGNARNLSFIASPSSSLYLIWDALEKISPDSRLLMQELIKIYFFDLLFLNSDRKLHNIMLVNTISSSHLYMIDNSLLFSSGRAELFSSLARYDDLEVISSINWDNNKQNELNRHNLEYFLQTSAKEYIVILESMIKLVPVEVLKKVIEDIELEYNYEIPDKAIMLEHYQINLENIKTILESRGELYEPRIHKNK